MNSLKYYVAGWGCVIVSNIKADDGHFFAAVVWVVLGIVMFGFSGLPTNADRKSVV